MSKLQFVVNAIKFYIWSEFAAYMLGRKLTKKLVRVVGRRFLVGRRLRTNHGR